MLVTGPTGSGKSHDARRDRRPDQRDAQLPHHHDRGPDRVRAPEQALPDAPARDRERTRRASPRRCKAAGREDPDLVLVGEMRDLETISMALAAAEKGTIVFGTLHTNNAVKTVDRIISVFPASEQDGHPQRARRDAARGGRPAADAEGRRRPRGGDRDPVLLARDRQHDPRGQDRQITSAIQTGHQGGHDRHGHRRSAASTTRRRSAPAPPSTRRSTSRTSRTCSRAERRARTEPREAARITRPQDGGRITTGRRRASTPQPFFGGATLNTSETLKPWSVFW